ncbi:ATP-binding cassette domain-containing protein [Cellulosimicrobium cellulans]|uniref:ABC transporter ATP-binding protein n=1 Tax=Cellulosimicrobium cellulans TaxID=1710 RepID=UPI0019640B46|nr:ATP-binding cassette domain-containing protein [Cellulosimicrobium cellulans]MBN0039797.1 ATP-binding cassette domain-containing protein [Cellulosimicrobium cellulans]
MLTIDSLVKRHGPRTVLDHVSFEAAPGRVTAFLGPNGAGKSSTLRVLLGLDRADEGRALVDGRPYRSLRDPLRVVGSMLDGSGAHRSRRARDHLAWVARSNGLPRGRVDAVLDQVGLAEAAHVRVGRFSLGMGRRLGLACALLGEPATLVLDEPVNGLDPEGIRWIRGLLRAHADAGGTVLLSSHLMGEVAGTADDLVVICEGRVVASGTLDAVTAGYQDLEQAFFALTAAPESAR